MPLDRGEVMDARPSAMRCALWICAVVVGLTGSALSLGADPVDSITVQAQREREKLEHDVNQFVSTAIVQSHYDESLERWTYAPVCPLVAGVSRELGEFVLARVSQIARTAGAPLGAEKCQPNFFVIVSPDDPAPRLARLTHKNGGQLFNYETGAELKKFVEISRPVRVWYNTGATSIDGASMMSELVDTGSFHAQRFENSRGPEPVHNTLPSIYGSRTNASLVTRDILSVIIVVDAKKVTDINIGQLADYVGLIGLAQINLDKDLDDAPTILSLFRGSEAARPKEMTEWDKALLHALYSTPQRSKMQISAMQTAALKDITSNSTH
jgi:hypothetical protein